MLPNYDLIDDFLPFASMKATAGQNILHVLGAFSADNRNVNAYNARQMVLVENALVKSHNNTVIYNNCCAYLFSIYRKWSMTLMTRMDGVEQQWKITGQALVGQ